MIVHGCLFIVDCFSLCLFLLLYLCFKVWGGVGAGPAEGRVFIFVIVFVFGFVFVLWCVWGGGGGVGAAEGRVWLWVRALPPRGVTCRGRYAHHHHIPTIPTNHNFMSIIIIISMMATSFFFRVRIFQPQLHSECVDYMKNSHPHTQHQLTHPSYPPNPTSLEYFQCFSTCSKIKFRGIPINQYHHISTNHFSMSSHQP